MADDEAVTRVVTFLDGLTARGDLDRILDPVRPRLRSLAAPKRLRMPRLLFAPLDGAIVAAADWARGQPQVPRSALMALSQAVEAALGPPWLALAAEAQAITTDATEAISRLGERLWPAAATALPDRLPDGWLASGLSASDYAPIAALCRPMWAAGAEIWAAMVAAPKGPPEALALAALAAVVPAGPDALGMALSSLLLRAAAPGRLISLAAGLHRQARLVAQSALDKALEAPLLPFSALAPQQAAEAAVALAGRLDDLETCALLNGPRQHRLAACRRAAEASFRTCYIDAVQAHVVQPIQRLAVAETVTDADVTTMEAAARQMRALEAAGRRLGGAARHDASLQEAAEVIIRLATQGDRPGGLTRMDLARSLEILAGPDAAAALLAAS